MIVAIVISTAPAIPSTISTIVTVLLETLHVAVLLGTFHVAVHRIRVPAHVVPVPVHRQPAGEVRELI